MYSVFVVAQNSVQEGNLDKVYLGFFVLELNIPLNGFHKGGGFFVVGFFCVGMRDMLLRSKITCLGSCELIIESVRIDPGFLPSESYLSACTKRYCV